MPLKVIDIVKSTDYRESQRWVINRRQQYNEYEWLVTQSVTIEINGLSFSSVIMAASYCIYHDDDLITNETVASFVCFSNWNLTKKIKIRNDLNANIRCDCVSFMLLLVVFFFSSLSPDSGKTWKSKEVRLQKKKTFIQKEVDATDKITVYDEF